MLTENPSLKRYFLLEPSLETVLLRRTDHRLGVEFMRHRSAIAQVILAREKNRTVRCACMLRVSIRFEFYGICSSGLELESLFITLCPQNDTFLFFSHVLLIR